MTATIFYGLIMFFFIGCAVYDRCWERRQKKIKKKELDSETLADGLVHIETVTLKTSKFVDLLLKEQELNELKLKMKETLND